MALLCIFLICQVVRLGRSRSSMLLVMIQLVLDSKSLHRRLIADFEASTPSERCSKPSCARVCSIASFHLLALLGLARTPTRECPMYLYGEIGMASHLHVKKRVQASADQALANDTLQAQATPVRTWRDWLLSSLDGSHLRCSHDATAFSP